MRAGDDYFCKPNWHMKNKRGWRNIFCQDYHDGKVLLEGGKFKWPFLDS